MALSEISIIVPNYNHVSFLPERLNSIFNQTYQDFEVILLDDASTDGSIELLSKFARHPKVSHFIVNEQNTGSPFIQWKKGIDLANGHYIWIAESDDWCDYTFLERGIQFIKTNGCELVYCRSMFDFIDKSKNRKDDSYTFLAPERWEKEFVNSGNSEIKNYLIYKNTITNASAVLFKNSRENMPFSEIENMRYCGDWYLWSVYLRGRTIGFIPETLNHFRCHINSTRSEAKSTSGSDRLKEIAKVIVSIKKQFGIKLYTAEAFRKYQWLLLRIEETKKVEGRIAVLNALKAFPVEIRLFILVYKVLFKLNVKYR